MSIEMIGKQIATMRKERGIKQEELASFVGVSTQAVSKWENGGVPDTELLPKIADFFSVSVDFLFGRNVTNYSDLQTALINRIIDTPLEERFKVILNYCWDMERATFDRMPRDGGIEDYEADLGEREQRYSSVMTDYGFTRMGIANRLQYFLIVPEIKNTDSAFFDGVDYVSFFKDFSDRAVFDACILLNGRDSSKAFTESLLVKKLNIDAEKAKDILAVFEKYHLIRKTLIETDDEIMTVYKYIPTPSIIAILIFAKEILDTPRLWSYYNEARSKPYFN